MRPTTTMLIRVVNEDSAYRAEPRRRGVSDARGSLIEYESHKIRKITQSTTVAELYSLMKCFGTSLFLRGLWMDMTGTAADIHMRTDAKNLVPTAQTTHLPQQGLQAGLPCLQKCQVTRRC